MIERVLTTLALIAILASCTSLPRDRPVIEQEFYVLSLEGSFVLSNADDSICLNAIADPKVAAKIKPKAADPHEAQPYRIRITRSTLLVNQGTYVHRMGELILSSGHWVKLREKQVFLGCSTEDLYEIIEVLRPTN